MKIFAPIPPLLRASGCIRHEHPAPDATPGRSWIVWPDSCWLLSRRPLFVPDFAPQFIAVPAMAAKIGRLGKTVGLRFAHRYVSEYSAALIILPLRAVNDWEEGMNPQYSDICFDNSLVIGEWMKAEAVTPERNFTFTLQLGDKQDQSSRIPLSASLQGIYSLITEVSGTNTLKMGDVMLLPMMTAGSDTRSSFPIRENLTAQIFLSPSDDDPGRKILHTNFK